MSNKLTFAVDSNHFLHTTLGVMGSYSKGNQLFLKDSDEEDRRQDTNVFLEKLSQIFAKDIRNLGGLIDEVVFTVDDSRSWRKDHFEYRDYLGIPNSLDYKGTRSKDKTVDWNAIYETFNNFIKGVCLASNASTKSMEGCEADDLVFAVASLYNSRGKSVLIYSGDNDLKQCVGFDHSTSAFTMQYQKQQKKVCLDKDTGFFLKKQGNTPLVNNIKSFINNSETKMLIVNPYEVVFDKVVMGDLGDNILPVASEIKLYKSGAKEGQEYESKVNAGTIKKIKEELNFLEYGVEDLFVDEFISKIASSVIRNFKADTKFKLDEVINNLKLNVSLVLLHKNTIPTSLYEGMIDWVETLHDSSKTTNTRKLCYQKDILQHISSYDKKETDNASSASIFKGLGL